MEELKGIDMFKHKTGGYFAGAFSALEYIADYLKEHDGHVIHLDDMVSLRRGATLIDKIEVLKESLVKISKTLEETSNE